MPASKSSLGVAYPHYWGRRTCTLEIASKGTPVATLLSFPTRQFTHLYGCWMLVGLTFHTVFAVSRDREEDARSPEVPRHSVLKITNNPLKYLHVGSS